MLHAFQACVRGRTLVTVAAVSTLGLIGSSSMAQSFEAKTSTSWRGTAIPFTNFISGRLADGNYTLGTNTVQVDRTGPSGVFRANSGAPTVGRYSTLTAAGPASAAVTLSRTVANGPNSSTTVKANSTIDVTPVNINNTTFYDVKMTLFASSNHNIFRATGHARARGADPFEVVIPGMFMQSLSLEPGSSLWVSPDADGDTGDAFYEMTAPGLSMPLARIDLFTTHTGGIDAQVELGSHAQDRLKFYRIGHSPADPGPVIPITASEVKSLIESSVALNTAEGLISPLDLFTWSYDLTGLSSTIGGEFAFVTEAGVTMVPEPATGAMVAVAAGVLLRRRRAKVA